MSQHDNNKPDLTKVLPEVAASEILKWSAIDGIFIFRHWRGNFYCWYLYAWEKMSQHDFDSQLYYMLEQLYQNLNKNSIDDVRHSIIEKIHLYDTIEPPTIIERPMHRNKPSAEWDLRQAVFGTDGILYLPWLEKRTKECFISPTPSIFNTTYTNTKVQLRKPAWDKRLEQLEDPYRAISKFVQSRCKVGVEYSVPKKKIFDAYQKWCVQNGLHKLSSSRFFLSLNRFAPGLIINKQSQGSKQVLTVSGIKLSPA